MMFTQRTEAADFLGRRRRSAEVGHMRYYSDLKSQYVNTMSAILNQVLTKCRSNFGTKMRLAKKRVVAIV